MYYNQKKLCIVICTKNRPRDLFITLKSILQNTLLPYKIVLIDSSDHNYQNEVIKYVEAVKLYIKQRHINTKLIYIYDKDLSLTQARNKSLQYTDDCDIVGFLDDDIIIHKNYLKEIVNVFEKNNNIYAAQGLILNTILYSKKLTIYKRLLETIYALLPVSSLSLRKPKVNFFLRNKYPLFPPIDKEFISSEWLSGCNMFYRSEVFYRYRFRFDEKLIRYCLGEDLDFSYNLFRNNFALAMVPKAYIVHRPRSVFNIQGNEKKKTKLSLKLMDLAYRFYFLKKYYRSNRVSLLIFLTYSILLLAYNILRKNIYSAKTYLYALKITLKLRKYIYGLDLTPINKMITVLSDKYKL